MRLGWDIGFVEIMVLGDKDLNMGFELRFDKVVRIDSLDLDLGCWD